MPCYWRYFAMGVELIAKEPQFVERCQDDKAQPHIAAHWLELERILAVFDLAEGLIINQRKATI